MPRAKRPLAEADANAPSSKKATMRAASGKENVAASYSSKTVAELSEMLKERLLPRSGKKADLVQRLVDADGSKAAAPASASSDKVANSLHAVSSYLCSQDAASPELEFVTMC